MTAKALTVTGTSNLKANVTTTQAQTYQGAVTLVGDRTLKGAAINFETTVTGDNNNLTIEADSGNIIFGGNLSSIKDLTLNKANNVSFIESISLTGDMVQLTGTGNTHFSKNAYAKSFNIKTQTITLDSGKEISTSATNGDIKLFTDNLAISGFLDSGTGGITIAPLDANRELFVCSGTCLTDANYDSGNPNHALYNIGGDFSYKANSFSIGSAGHLGNITLYQFNPSFDLSLATAGSINVSGVFTSNYSLSLEGSSGINISHNISTKGNQYYKGSLVLTDNDNKTAMTGVELTSSNGSITFDATINSELDSVNELITSKSFGLTLSAASDIIFNKAVGEDLSKNKLEYLKILSNSNIKINSNISTKTDQNYEGRVFFTGNRQLNSENIATKNGIKDDGGNITINGNWYYKGTSNLTTSQLTIEGTSQLSGSLITNGQQRYNKSVTLVGDTLLKSVSDQLIFEKEITGNHALNIVSESKNFTQNASINLGSLSIKASDISLNGQITTLENQDYQGSLMLLNDSYLTAKNASDFKLISINGDINGNNKSLNITANWSFKGNANNINKINVSGKTNLEGNITSTGNQYYGEKLTLTGVAGSIIHLTSNVGQLIKMDGGLSANNLNLSINNADWHLGSLGANSLKNLTIGAKSILGGNISAEGEVKLQGGIELANSDIKINADKVYFYQFINGNNFGLDIQSNVSIAPSTNTNNLKHLEISGTSLLGGNINTTSYQKYNQQVTLSGNSQITASKVYISNGLIGNNYYLKALAEWQSNGNLTNLASLEITGNTYLNGIINTTGTNGQTYSGLLNLTNDTRFLTAGHEISFNGDINGDFELLIDASKTNINANIGNTTPLKKLTINGNTQVSQKNITTQGNQNYLGLFNASNHVNLISHSGSIHLSQPANIAGNFSLTGNEITLSNINTSGSLSLYSNTNIHYTTGTELKSGSTITFAINQSINTSGLSLDLNTLTFEANKINLLGSNYDRIIGFTNTTNKWVLNGSYQGSLESTSLKSTNNIAFFNGFNQITGGNKGDTYSINSTYLGNLILGAGDDTVIFSSTGKLSVPLNGGSGNNTYDISGWGATTIVLDEGYENFNRLIANGATLQGSKYTETYWNLSGSTSGTVNTTSFSGFSSLISGLGGTNYYLSNGQYIGNITLINNNNWNYSAGSTLTQGNILGSGTLNISTPASGKGGNLTIGTNDLLLPKLNLHTGTTIIGGSLSLNNLPLKANNIAQINTDNLTITQPIYTGGNLVLFGADITLATSQINTDGSISLIATGDICNGCVGGLSGNGDLIVNQQTTLKANSGQIIAARGIVNASDLVLDFNGGAFELAVSAEQKENSQPSSLSNVRSLTLLDTTSAFIEQLGLNLVSVTVNFTNPAAAVMGVRAIEVIDLGLFEEDLTLFGRLGEGVALAFEQCEEIEGCTPDVTEEELSAAIEAIELRIQQLELELKADNNIKRTKQIQNLLAGYQSERQELTTYKKDLQEFTGFEEAFADDFGTTNEIDMEALQREVTVIETIYTRVRFLESLQFNKERREDFAQRTGLDLSSERLSQIIDSTLKAAELSEARVEKMLAGE